MNIKILLPALIFGLFFTQQAKAGSTYPFDGKIDFESRQFQFNLKLAEGSSADIHFFKSAESQYKFRLNLQHIKSPAWDFSSQIDSFVNIEDFQPGELEPDHKKVIPRFSKLTGKVWSQYSLVDYKPIRELKGDFEIVNDRLYLKSFSFGQISFNGHIELIRPFKVDVDFILTAVDLDDFLSFWGPEKDFDSTGDVNGEIKVSGTRNYLMMKGRLKSVDGYIKKLRFDNLNLNIEGVYPNMQITKSFFSKKDGMTYSFEGPFDLSDRTTFKKQIKSLKIQPIIKDSKSEREWTIIRRKEESGKTEFKYRMQKGDSYGVSDSKESDMLGVERTLEF